MSQIQNASNSAYAAQWQYLHAMPQAGSDPMLQPGASDPMSFGLDPFSGASGQAQPVQGGNSGPPFSLGAMSALIAAQEQSSGTAGLSAHQQKVFGELDADGDGTVTGAELQSAFGSDNTDIANYVMRKLDTDGDGSISQSEFGAGTTRGAGHHHRHMHMGAMPGAQGTDGQAAGTQGPLAQLLSADGANAQTTSNSDGSTTTTITYSDGSKVSMTSAASSGASSGSGDGSTSGNTSQQTQANLLEQLIKMQAQLVQSVAPTTAATI